MKVHLFMVIMILWLLIMIIYFTIEFVISSLFYYQETMSEIVLVGRDNSSF